MLGRKDIAVFLQKLARFPGLSDGAKVTFLEFLYHFWSDDKNIPSYSELCDLRKSARSTIQLHIAELEQSGLLISIRLPNNRKRYRANFKALDGARKIKKKGRQEPVKKFHKNTSKYTTAELCGYFYFLRNTITGGQKQTATRAEYNQMKTLHRRIGSSMLVNCIDYFKRIYSRKKLPFTLQAFLDKAVEFSDRLLDNNEGT